MCTTLTINNFSVDTIGGVKQASPLLYRLIQFYVNDPWGDEDCLCTVDFDQLMKDEPELNIKKTKSEYGLIYTVTLSGLGEKT